MKPVDYKALGSIPREHEKLIPFKQLVNNIFFAACSGEKKRMPYDKEPPGGIRGEGSVVLKNDRKVKKPATLFLTEGK
jgi:hypothetical protein